MGRTYEAVIRVNSQSGKGGVAYLLKSEHNLDLPRRAQIEFSRVIQERTDTEGGEMTADQIWKVFTAEYLDREVPLRLNSVHTSSAAGERDQLSVNVYVDGSPVSLTGEGNGPIAAFVNAINDLPAAGAGTSGCSTTTSTPCPRVVMPSRRRTSSARFERPGESEVLWGVGLDPNIVTASLKAVISAVNRRGHA